MNYLLEAIALYLLIGVSLSTILTKHFPAATEQGMKEYDQFTFGWAIAMAKGITLYFTLASKIKQAKRG